MTHDVPLVASLFISLVGAVVLALIALLVWHQFFTAALVYSLGGAVLFLVTTAALALRMGPSRER